MIEKDLVFIDNMQSINPSLEKLVKNLAEDKFKYLVKIENLVKINWN